jgi:prevent-host-death family protein
MKVASLADVKARLSAYIEDLPSKGPVVITRNGRPAAVLIAPKDDEDLERLLLARSEQFQAILNESRRSLQAGQGLSPAEFWIKVRSRRNKRTKHAARSKRT